jgi:hypothetical protein
MRWALLFCAVFWALVASLIVRACSDADGQGVRIAQIERPPARFIQERQTAFVNFLPHAELEAQCGRGNIGCATVGGSVVWMPHPCDYPREGYAALLCHELAHNNGWEHD